MGEDALARGHQLDGPDDFARRGVLEDEPVGAGSQRAQHQLVCVEGGEHEDVRRPGLPAQERGGCEPIQLGHCVGSAFKLYVLDALGRAVASGRVSWDQLLTVTACVKSLPSGVLETVPDGTRVPVRRAADEMISISDNTAADLLIARVGRTAVDSDRCADSTRFVWALPTSEPGHPGAWRDAGMSKRTAGTTA